MDSKAFARIIAIVIIAVALTVRAIHLVLDDGPATVRSSAPIGAETSRTDPVREMLARCQGIGEAATRDADCLAAWAENRRRFLGQDEER